MISAALERMPYAAVPVQTRGRPGNRIVSLKDSWGKAGGEATPARPATS